VSAAKSTTGMGKEHEEYIVSLLEWDSARRSRSSGASFHDPIDITSDGLVMECEATENKSYSLKLDFWNEVTSKAHTGKLPALGIRFRDTVNDKHTDLIVMEAHDVAQMLEELEAYRSEALKKYGRS
jgi:hypothetical protein